MKRSKYTILFICITTCIALAACGKKKENEIDKVVIAPAPTEAPIATPASEEQVPDKTEIISEDDAISNIKKIIGERGYTIELLDSHLTVGETEYYVFQVSDSSTVIEPNIIVDKVSGELSCYYKDGTVDSFENHPLFTPSAMERCDKYNKEDALDLLSKVPAKSLNLPKPLSEYTIVYDDWETFVNGVECYGINVFASGKDDEDINMGLYYVANDGSVVFQYDSLSDNFVEIFIRE